MSKTRIPEWLDIYGRIVHVEYKEKLFNPKGEELDGDTDGEIINISLDAKKKEHLGILLHEMFHCYIRRSGIYYREDWDTNLEEQMAEGFTTIILENFILRSRH